jgi:RHS repeat-associated protein
LIEYGNDTQTTYTYDPFTFRLTQLTTKRLGFPQGQQTVQDLFYSYDPMGNITHIQDDADSQNVVFFRNQRVEPSNDYTYDALYRLILASGREQLGLGGDGNQLPPTASSYNDVPRIGLTPSQGDGRAVGLYTEQYLYDPVGNFQQLIHRGPNLNNPGWTRTYTYAANSLLEPGKVSNRLSSSAISGNQPLNEPYAYDSHGNMISMPQLQVMQWDFKDQLLMTTRRAVNPSDSDGTLHQGERTYYVYDSAGQRARKVTESSAGIKKKERFYLGGFEVYREYDSGGAITLERQTLHVMDDKQRVALVETRTQGNDGSPAQLQRYQFSNHLGSASLELDDQAQVISYEEYCPYGNTSYQAGRSAVEVALKRYRYTGMERDEESGLSYHTARYYATWLGRWTQTDPIGIKGGLDLYAFSSDNPCVWTDSSGAAPKKGSPGDPDSPQSMGDLMHYYTLAAFVIRARALGLDATFQTETAVGGSRSGKDRGLVDFAIRVDGVHHIYDLKKQGSSISQAERWVKKYADYYRGGLGRDQQGPGEPAIPGTVVEEHPEILAPIFYEDPKTPFGIYAIEFNLPTRNGSVIPGIIEYKYHFIEWKDVSLEWQKRFVEERGFEWQTASDVFTAERKWMILDPVHDQDILEGRAGEMTGGGKAWASDEATLVYSGQYKLWSDKVQSEYDEAERRSSRELDREAWQYEYQNTFMNMFNGLTAGFTATQLPMSSSSVTTEATETEAQGISVLQQVFAH